MLTLLVFTIELLEQGLIRENNGLRLCHMKIMMDETRVSPNSNLIQNPDLNGKISYLYKVMPGKASSSFGICCAKLCGVDPDVIKLAEKIYQEKVRGGNFSTLFLRFSAKEQQRMKNAGRVIKEFIKTDLDRVGNAKVYLKELLELANYGNGDDSRNDYE